MLVCDIQAIRKQPQGRKTLICGLGKSGYYAAKLCCELGMQVIGSDMRHEHELEFPFHELPMELDCGGHSIKKFVSTDLIIVSPGVPDTIAPLTEARARGIPLIGEMEWAAGFIKSPIVAITGTNGKTTTTSLTGHILSECGFDTFTGGNIGTPLSAIALESDQGDVCVLECSSYQLETLDSSIYIAALLNITPDHLDRYESFATYAEAKLRLMDLVEPSGYCIINADDDLIAKTSKRCQAQLLGISKQQGSANPGAFLQNEQIMFQNLPNQPETKITVSANHEILKGFHNVQNASFAMSIALLMGVSAKTVMEAYATFKGVPHRLEPVDTVAGIACYNDSKATNDKAAAIGVLAFDKPIHLLAGGKDKGTGYGELKTALAKSSVVHVYLFGEAASLINSEIGPLCNTSCHQDMDEAFAAAIRQAKSGSVILLSPACASFDQFKNYEMRGQHFKKLVAQAKVRLNNAK